MKRFTLITGASGGIGREMAIVCAQRGFNLLLVALADSNLAELSEELRNKYRVDIDFLELDFSKTEAVTELYHWCTTNNYEVDMLINNLGIGGKGKFKNIGLGDIQKMIHLNIYILSAVTNLFLPMLSRQPRAYILNVSSTAAYFNIPQKIVYSATKAYVNTFTSSLRIELKGSNISVSLLCPGGSTHRVDQVVEKRLNNYFTSLVHETPQAIAKGGIDGMLKSKKLILPGFASKVYMIVSKVTPAFIRDRITNKLFTPPAGEKLYTKPPQKKLPA